MTRNGTSNVLTLKGEKGMVNLSSLFSFNFVEFLERKPAKAKKSRLLKSVNYSEMAFQIATTDNLSKVLPALLMQPSLIANCMTELSSFDTLFILHATPDSAPTLYNAANTSHNHPLSRYFESLNFDLPMTEKPSLKTEAGYAYLPIPLNVDGDVSSYLIVSFKEQTLAKPHQILQFVSPLKLALEKGISAYFEKTQAVIEAVNHERLAQAADMHDSIAQILSYLKLKSSSLSRQCKNPQYEALHTLSKDIEDQVSYAHRITRELISSSRLALQDTNLSASIHAAITEFEQLSGIVFELDNRCQPQLEQIKNAKEILFIVRESLCNLVRHSHASHARIVITSTPLGTINILVEDNGTGINHATKRSNSFGLQIMEERARKIQAHLKITDRDKGGTRVHLSIPNV